MADRMIGAGAAAADPRAARGLGESLMIVLGGASTRNVMAIGEAARKWSNLFSDAAYAPSLEALEPLPGQPDLIIYDSSLTTCRQLGAELTKLRSMMGPAGRMIVLVRNPFALPSRRQALGRLRDLLRGILWTKGWMRLLSSVGFAASSGFLAKEGADRPRTLTSLQSHPFATSPPSRRLLKWLWKTPLYTQLAGDWVFFAGPEPAGHSKLFRRINVLRGQQGMVAQIEHLDHLDFRHRGALVAILSTRDGRRLVARVVSDPSVDAVVTKNAQFLTWLLDEDRLTADLRSKLPWPMGSLKHEGASTYLETFISGAPAWKVDSPSAEGRISAEAEDFIWRLQLATRRPVQFHRGMIADLFHHDLERLDEVDASPGLRGLVKQGIEAVAARLAGRDGGLVASHGDYGYGNIFADPATGRLTGVIDWDTGRRTELPATDLLNHRVQRERVRNGSGVFAAFRAVARCLESDPEATGIAYQDSFGFDRSTFRRTILLATHLRYLLRAAQYPEVFATQQEEYLRTFALFDL